MLRDLANKIEVASIFHTRWNVIRAQLHCSLPSYDRISGVLLIHCSLSSYDSISDVLLLHCSLPSYDSISGVLLFEATVEKLPWQFKKYPYMKAFLYQFLVAVGLEYNLFLSYYYFSFWDYIIMIISMANVCLKFEGWISSFLGLRHERKSGARSFFSPILILALLLILILHLGMEWGEEDIAREPSRLASTSPDFQTTRLCFFLTSGSF